MATTLSPKERIKAAKPQRRSTRINLRGDLVAEIERLDLELEEAQQAELTAPKRLASKSPTMTLANRIEELRKEMADHWLELVLEQQPWSVWREFKTANPPRDDVDLDKLVACNFDVLAADFLPKCVVEPSLDAEDWDGIFERISPADIRDTAALAFSLHEQGLDIPKSRRASAVRARSAAESEQPKASG